VTGPLPRLVPADDGVAALEIASDAQPYLSPGSLEAMTAIVERVAADAAIRAVVLVGGEQCFCAGASRDSLLRSTAGTDVPRYVAELPRLVLSIPVPTVAAMAGHAVGGGLVVGLWCDTVVLADESLYGANFMALGFTPGMGATTALEHWLGPPLARELLFTGRLVKGRELKPVLSHAVRPRRDVRERAFELAREMAQAPRDALLALKAMFASERRESLERALAREGPAQAALLARAETRRLVGERYAFLAESGSKRE